MVLCKIIHGDQFGEIVDLNQPAAEAGQAFGTHRILNPDERPPELPNNSEVHSVVKPTTPPGDWASRSAAEQKLIAAEVAGHDIANKTDAKAAIEASLSGTPDPGMVTDRGAADASVAQKARDEDPRMQGTKFGVAPADAPPKTTHSTASKSEEKVADEAKPTLVEEAGKSTSTRTFGRQTTTTRK